MRALGPLCLVVLAALGCVPLTFSKQPAVDFDRYRSVTVHVTDESPHAIYAEQYLTARLRESSGFELVTADPAALADLTLEIELGVTVEVETDEEGDVSYEYAGSASYVATTREGRTVDFGSEEDRSESELEVIEDVLDQIEYHYLAPYEY